MRNLLLIFFIMFSAFIFSNDNQIIKNNQKIDEKNYQNTKDNDKIEDLNTNTEKSKTIENPSVCFNDFKELEKNIEPKAYTDCREIKMHFVGI